MNSTPYISKDDIVKGIYNEHFYTPGDSSTKTLGFKTASGTTGRGVSLVLERAHLSDKFTFGVITAFMRIGMQNVNTFTGLSALLGLETTVRATSLEYEDLKNEDLGALIQEFAPSDIMIAPSASLHALLKNLRENDGLESLSSLQRIYLGGEYLSKNQFLFLQSLIPSHITLINDYVLSETNTIGYNCPRWRELTQNPNLEYIHPLESVEVETLGTTPNEPGELVVSTPNLKHYKTGDAARIIKKLCVCSATHTVELLGRIDYDWVSAAGGVLHRTQIEEVLLPFRSVISDYRVVVTETYGKGVVRGKVTVLCVTTKRERLHLIQQDILRAINNIRIASTKTVRDAIEKGIFYPTTVEIVEELTADGAKRIPLQKVVQETNDE